jgi:hypothetical protein
MFAMLGFMYLIEPKTIQRLNYQYTHEVLVFGDQYLLIVQNAVHITISIQSQE